MSVPERVLVGLGSNLGDRRRTIEMAVDRVAALPGVDLVGLSVLRETPPWGPVRQGPFLNGAVALRAVGWTPRAFLDACLAVERALGRVRGRGERWGPRTIDLDLLLFGDRVVREEGLDLPHPRLHERRFVLEPLADLVPELVHPVLGRTIAALLDALNQSDASLDDPSAAVKPHADLAESPAEDPLPEPRS